MGHKRVVQYKKGTRYLCNYLRQQYPVPVCQHIPGDPVEATVVHAFFAALAPVDLDAYQRAVVAQQQTEVASARARAQQLQCLGLSVHWLYDRLHNGQIRLQKDPTSRLYLFPDHPTTIKLLTHLRAGRRQSVGFGQE